MQLGLIGLGRMGHAMGERLARAGHEVIGYDRDPEVSETRVIMLTGHARIADRDTGIAAGADEYVFKPFSPQDLLDRVDRVLEL